MSFIFAAIFLGFIFQSCESESKLEKEIKNLDIKLKMQRFDLEFADAKPQDLSRLKATYPYLFPAQFPDSVWTQKMQDTIQLEIEAEVIAKHEDFTENFGRLYRFFQHLHYYFPSLQIPKIVTLAEEVDYQNKVILNDSLLFISLDNYLGGEHHFYSGIYQYIAKLQDDAYLVSDVADEFIDELIPPLKERDFLSIMIYYGKKLYLKDKLMPFEAEHTRIHYDEAQLDWAFANEEQIWQFFVEKELLFSTDINLRTRFINLAPYSKFYLELDSESPPRLGQFIGWQIVRAYMAKNNDVSLEELIRENPTHIFNNSTYKPKR